MQWDCVTRQLRSYSAEQLGGLSQQQLQQVQGAIQSFNNTLGQWVANRSQTDQVRQVAGALVQTIAMLTVSLQILHPTVAASWTTQAQTAAAESKKAIDELVKQINGELEQIQKHREKAEKDAQAVGVLVPGTAVVARERNFATTSIVHERAAKPWLLVAFSLLVVVASVAIKSMLWPPTLTTIADGKTLFDWPTAAVLPLESSRTSRRRLLRGRLVLSELSCTPKPRRCERASP